jgi:transcriptional regulator with XRE-family HTH domain
MQVIATWSGHQADLLRQAFRMTNESFADHLGVSVRTVANWRGNPGVIPRSAIQEILDAALEHSPDRVKAQFALLISESESDKQQPDPLESFQESLNVTNNSEVEGSELLESIKSHVHEIVALDNRFGGADLLRLSTRFFRNLRDQLGTGSYDPRLERDLHSAAGELAEVVGWLAYDAEAHDLCRRMNNESLYFTRLAGDKSVELLTLQNSSMHAAAEGRPREALQIARSVLEGDYILSPRIKALFLMRKARALAQSGDESALRLLPEIRELYLAGVRDTDPAWAWWIDDRELAWHEAMVQRDLGLASKAIDYFERSVMATPADEIRSQYLHRAYLLQSQVENETWEAAERTVQQLIPLSREVASTRTAVILRGIPNQLRKRGTAPSGFREQFSMLSAALDESPYYAN